MNDFANRDRIAYWLLPGKKDERLLDAIIHRLARRFDAPVFAPHLTLLAISSQRLSSPLRSLSTVAAQTAPVTLEYTGTPEWSPVYNRALVLPFRLSPDLERLVRTLHPDRELSVDYQPHVSLVYTDLDRTAGETLVREIDLEKRSFCFDRCAAIAVGPRCRSERDVRMWKTLATHRLLGKKT